jgi:calcineurin-like phosphoesterase
MSNEQEIAGNRPVVIIDFHAESTKEKEALLFYTGGRASIFAGTHTHVQTADERIINGTAYISDLGMTGAVNSILGMDTGICMARAEKQVQFKMEAAKPEGKLKMQGLKVTVDGDARTPLDVERICRFCEA